MLFRSKLNVGGNNFNSVQIDSASDATLVDVNTITVLATTTSGFYRVSGTGITLDGAIHAGGKVTLEASSSAAGVTLRNNIQTADSDVDLIGTVLLTTHDPVITTGTGIVRFSGNNPIRIGSRTLTVDAFQFDGTPTLFLTIEIGRAHV